MASVKVVIRKNKMKKDGTCPLAIRIIKDRKTRFIFTGYYVLEKDWNADLCKVKKTHPNAVRLNNFLMKKVVEATDTTLDVENSNEEYSAKEIKQRIKKTKSKISFFQLAWKRIENYKAKGTYTVADSERSIINNINKFMNGKALFFEDIDQAFINEFKVFCSASLGQKTRTVTNQLIFIRTLFNQAIKEGIVQAKYYPFGGEKEKIRIGSGLKIGLTKEEVEKIENVELKEGSPLWHTRNVWLTSFYFAGIRVADVLKLGIVK